MLEKLTDKLMGEVAAFKDQEILMALNYALGDEFKLTSEIASRGEMVIQHNGVEHFLFDGRKLIAFIPIDVSFVKGIDGVFLNVSCRSLRLWRNNYPGAPRRYGEFCGSCFHAGQENCTNNESPDVPSPKRTLRDIRRDIDIAIGNVKSLLLTPREILICRADYNHLRDGAAHAIFQCSEMKTYRGLPFHVLGGNCHKVVVRF